MSARNDSFLDKLLGLVGFKRPKSKRTATAQRSSNRDITSQRVRKTRTHKSNSSGLVLNENFEIVSSTTEKKKKKKGSAVLKVLLSCFLIMVITGCVIVGAFMIYVFRFVDGTVDQDLNNLKLAYTSVIYAQNGKDDEGNPKYVELKRLHGNENRLWVDSEMIPDSLGKAFISAEDKRFNDHNGVDWKRTFSAAANLLFHFYDTEQGGSTITQQLIKNITDDDETSINRKIREIMRAQYLESRYSKDVILECYLNTIHLGPGIDGVEVAACYYFDKHSQDLTLTQCAALAAITKEPEHYNPYNNPEDNKTRRNWVLDEMCSNGYITAEERDEAKEADLGLRKTPSTVLSTTKTVEEKVNSYFVDAVIEDVIKGLMDKKNYSYKYAEQQLYAGGYKIYSTVDLSVQNTLEKVFKDDDNFMKVVTNSGKKAQAAMTVMDYEGHIVGIVGGRGEKTADRSLNRATQSPRQTGSSIKPVTCYSPGIEYNVITWGSRMTDEPTAYVDGKDWPVNYSGYYSGRVSVLYALQQSLNTIPVQLVQEMGMDSVYKFATDKMGITTLYDKIDVNGKSMTDLTLSSLALGGSVYGVTTTELTAAYCAIGNLGVYYTPHTYTKILDQHDNVVIDTSDEYHRAMSAETANVMCKMLQTVTTSGTGSAAAFDNWPIMSKTGTTTDTKDRWFVGCTPYYASAVWFGMDSSEAMGGLYSNPALKLWKAAMTKIMDGKKMKDFPQCDSVVYTRYCTSSGKVARTGCYNTAYGYFKSSYMPLCDDHGGEQVEASEKPKLNSSGNYESGEYSHDDDEEEETKPNKTEAPKTEAATEAPETEVSETEVPETKAPEPETEESGGEETTE